MLTLLAFPKVVECLSTSDAAIIDRRSSGMLRIQTDLPASKTVPSCRRNITTASCPTKKSWLGIMAVVAGCSTTGRSALEAQAVEEAITVVASKLRNLKAAQFKYSVIDAQGALSYYNCLAYAAPNRARLWSDAEDGPSIWVTPDYVVGRSPDGAYSTNCPNYGAIFSDVFQASDAGVEVNIVVAENQVRLSLFQKSSGRHCLFGFLGDNSYRWSIDSDSLIGEGRSARVRFSIETGYMTEMSLCGQQAFLEWKLDSVDLQVDDIEHALTIPTLKATRGSASLGAESEDFARYRELGYRVAKDDAALSRFLNRIHERHIEHLWSSWIEDMRMWVTTSVESIGYEAGMAKDEMYSGLCEALEAQLKEGLAVYIGALQEVQGIGGGALEIELEVVHDQYRSKISDPLRRLIQELWAPQR